MSLTGELWAVHAQNDLRNRELVQAPSGKRVTYDELLHEADPAIANQVNIPEFERKVASIQAGLDEVKRRFTETKPDVVVMIGDDQSEFFFDDNMPTINVYWGDSITMIPRTIRDDMSPAQKMSSMAYGTEEREYPVDSKLGLHIIESLMDQDFDVAQSK